MALFSCFSGVVCFLWCLFYSTLALCCSFSSVACFLWCLLVSPGLNLWRFFDYTLALFLCVCCVACLLWCFLVPPRRTSIFYGMPFVELLGSAFDFQGKLTHSEQTQHYRTPPKKSNEQPTSSIKQFAVEIRQSLAFFCA